jgi:uncharacterized cupin superfamily protein
MEMAEEQILKHITEELRDKHGCHTVILYGSRARGDSTDVSDYDVLGIRDSGDSFRDARVWNGAYLDIFVHPVSKLEDPHDGMLDMRFGKVLLEKDDTAKKFFTKLETIFARGPKKMADDEITAHRTWYQKALARIRIGDLQGNYRRAELVPALLQDFFTTRGEWYLGPKASFKWFKENRPDLLHAFEEAFKPSATVDVLESLVRLIDKEIEAGAKPLEKPASGASPDRPSFIKHWNEIQDPDTATYPGSDELLSIGSSLAKKLGLTKIGIHHEVLKPGRRTSWPHAESLEDEFGFVIEGHPDVWIDGVLHRLNPGDAVGFPSGTGISHTFINNTDSDVRLIVAGEKSKPDNKCVYPLHPERNKEIKDFLWEDYPKQNLGPHDGLPDKLRESKKP